VGCFLGAKSLKKEQKQESVNRGKQGETVGAKNPRMKRKFQKRKGKN
jgi:hypothetical protein